MRILLTGGTGFIGRVVARSLSEGGHRLFCTIRPGRDAPEGSVPVLADLGTGTIEDFAEPVDAIVHMAQSSRYRDFPAQASDIFNVNVAATASLLCMARKLGARCFVLASTGSVYSGGAGRMTEDAPVRPHDYYAATKVAAEAMLPPYRPYFRTCALRLFAPYGPGQRGRLIPTLIERVRSGTPISLDGPDGLRLATTYVDDVAATFVAAVENADWVGIYNVASPLPTSIREIGQVLGGLLGVAPVFERTGNPEPVALLPDLGRLGRQSRLPPFRCLREGLTSTLFTA